MRTLRNHIFYHLLFSLIFKMICKENIILTFFVDDGVRNLQRFFLLSIILVMAFWRWLILGSYPLPGLLSQ